MIASGSQNQHQSSLAPLGNLLKALMFLSNLNNFNFSPLPPVQGFNQRKGSSRVWKEKGSKWFYHFHFLSSWFCVCITCVFYFQVSSQSSFYVFLCLTCFFFFFLSFAFFFFHIKIKKKLKNQKNTKTVCVLCMLVLVYLGWPLKQNFLNFVSLIA